MVNRRVKSGLHKRLSTFERVKTFNFIEEHGALSEEGLWEYHNGWSDERVYQELGFAASVNATTHLRQNCFGKIRTARETSKVSTANDAAKISAMVSDVLKGMEQRIENLELWAAERPVVPFKF